MNISVDSPGFGSAHDRPRTDAALWSAAADGDADAFGALFERHSDAVYNHCFRRTADWGVAEDLTSLVFLQAWRRRRAVAMTGESVLPWLLAVANNLLRNADRMSRRQRRLMARLRPAAAPTAEPGIEEDLAARLDDERTMRRIRDGFERLPAAEREVLSLVAWAGLSYADVAVVLEVPVGTVKSRLARARSRLRQMLPDDALDGIQENRLR
ncbi:RNA polymerase sigma factor [Actinomadura sp. NEAU-AAG7]|uniref:RNA polymerase sigma factor n=1 Tax=Actinomadura sp. NEAU-AAG7 TaxID=2839640 RepID=UPI001BE4B065|nr:RNA polymerase sigma factor [Actinomadura sp. NEAU-AAG7]MBT2212090.1 RNA polymerase sigma factor [Actinomadura sp. NEAU-AAG7]